MIRLSAFTLSGLVVASAVTAGPIGSACARSDRGAGNLALCGCIQQVADATLTGRDQRIAAQFFSDPHQAQEIRMSDRASDEVFWRRYQAFGSAAEAYCN